MARKRSSADRSRRRFLEQMGGAAIGAITLSACGRDSRTTVGIDPSRPSLPTGYRFYPISPAGAAGLPGNLELSPLVMLNDVGMLLLYAVIGDAYGLFAIDLGLDSGPPAIKAARPVLTTGTTLADGRRVDSIDTVDINNGGSIAVVLGTDGEINTDALRLMGPGVYLSRERGAFESLAGLGDEVPGSDGMFGGAFGDLALHDEDNLLLTAMYADRPKTEVTTADTVFSGLFHLPSVSLSNGREIASSMSTLRGTDRSITRFGLVDLAQGGEYAAQVFAANRDQALDAIMRGTPAPPSGSLVISSSVKAARGAIDVLRPATAVKQGDGSVYFGPRVAANGKRALVVHYSDADAVLYFGDDVVARTGSASPLGNTIRGLSAPVVGPDGLLFYLLTLDGGKFELGITNGTDKATILTSGQQIGGKKVVMATHGYHSDQADSEARIAFYAEFEDGSNAVLVGIPV